MNLKSYVSKFLTNKLVLNIITILALFNLIGYLIIGNFNNVFVFIILALLVRYFSKNMIIVLGIPLIFVNLLALKTIAVEGLENNKKMDSSTSDSSSSNSITTNSRNSREETHKKLINKINQKNNSLDIQDGEIDNINLDNTNLDNTNLDNTNLDNTNLDQETFQMGNNKKNKKIDYASTIEDAYDQLNSVLGSDGIKSLTDDTQNLMKQQAELANSMKQMGPLIQGMAPMMETAKDLMKNMNSNSFKGVMDMATNFTKNMGDKKE
jgi:hypothetical protein